MERTQINKIRDENGKINNGHHRNTKDHTISNCIPTKWTTSKKCTKRYSVSRLNQEKNRIYIYRSITSSEVESVIKNLPTNQIPGLDDFIMNSTKYLLIGKN